MRLRKAQRLTQAVVATRSALAQNYISELERATDVNPTLEVLERVATALGTDISGLLQEPPDDVPSPAHRSKKQVLGERAGLQFQTKSR